ncbi:DUF2125 domain-containing protein [Plastorhodobacter daqingensis]|uniref:DUF2125 domain-containing protein n=1 Tax=Plastorhodobacter daqingensis TaxID=1387281 RepID=A0ABW2UFY8_9RHOB
MIHIRHIGFGAAIAALMGSTAVADVTPEEVWADLQRLYVDLGYSVEPGTEAREGDTLVVRDAALLMAAESDDDDAGLSVSFTLPEQRFRDLGDGRVEGTASPNLPVIVTLRSEEEETVTFELDIEMTDFVTLASGTPEAVIYDWSAAQMVVAGAFPLQDPDSEDEAGEILIDALAGGLTGRISRTDDGLLQSSSDTETISVEALGTGPAGEHFDIAFTMQDVHSDQITPPGMGESALGFFSSLSSNRFARGEMRFGPMTVEAEFDDPETGSGNFTFAADAGTFTFDLSQSGLHYASATEGMTFALTGAQLPVPVSGSLAESGATIIFPMAEGPEQDYGLGLRLVDLTLNDEVWALVDPAGALPRDPLTAIIDASGTATIFVALTDEAAILETDAPPAQLDSLRLNELRIEGIGARVTGTGQFTFDNSDMETFDGFPRPQGVLDLTLVGINALIDRMVQLGVVPQDQAMGTRMMMSMFTRPGSDADTLESTIEVREDGGVYANGQRIR